LAFKNQILAILKKHSALLKRQMTLVVPVW